MLINSNQNLEDAFRDIKHEINRAVLDKKHPFRYVSIASHDENSVSLRYVVLRDVTDDLELIVYTDSRTQKVEHLNKKPETEVLFYHPIKKLQIRFSGKAQIHLDDKVTKAHWEKQNEKSAKAYNSKYIPGEIIAKPENAHEWPEELTDRFFAVIRILPRKIDVLQLNRDEHLRLSFENIDGIWQKHWIAP